ncbi:MAG: TetR/AcrR family transcriptional regulator, partial [Caulobacterales bacterium]|nr:TetR/AcrR family transcriptional regulator [Caulobacterales bacterium]
MQILDAFESLLCEEELIAITIAKVAERAEVKRTLVYHFFPNIETMASALTDRYCKELQRRCTERLAGDQPTDFRAAFGGITRIHAQYLNENRAAAKLLLGDDNPVATLSMPARPG